MAPADRSSPRATMWKKILPTLGRHQWSVLSASFSDFDGRKDGVAILPLEDGSFPDVEKVEALRSTFPNAPVYLLWRHWPAYHLVNAAIAQFSDSAPVASSYNPAST